MSIYKPKSFHRLRFVSVVLRQISLLLRIWPLIVLAAILVLPIGPHMLFNYTYRQHGTYRYMLSCTYLGSHGFVRYARQGTCPFIVFLDSRTGRPVFQ